MSITYRGALLAAIVFTAGFLAGCANPAPNYAASIDNVEAFKRTGAAPLKPGLIGVTQGMPGATALQLRANTMVTPVGAHYGDYIAAALRQELELARMYDPQSGVEISGTLLKNNIDAGGINTNEGQIEARFVVQAKGQTRFDKVKRIEHQWESSFIGATAVPRAAANYPVMVQKLIGALVADPDFVKAIKP